MSCRLLGLVVLCAGCLDSNPYFVDTTGGPGSMPGATTTMPSTDDAGTNTVGPTSGPPTSTSTSTSTSMTSMTSMTGMTGTTSEPSEPTTSGETEGTGPMTMGEPVCGNNLVEPGEECDDGNAIDDDLCNNQCGAAYCGDMTIQTHEDCEDGNNVDDDLCNNECLYTTKYVFVTSELFNGSLGMYQGVMGLDGADKHCQELAIGAGMFGIYRAWLSTAEGSPSMWMPKWPNPYVLPNGTKVADSWADLMSGDIQNPINMTEKMGKPPPSTACLPSSVYTNTTPEGTLGDTLTDCVNWSVSDWQYPSWWGDSDATGKAWSHAICMIGCDKKAPIYCVEQ